MRHAFAIDSCVPALSRGTAFVVLALGLAGCLHDPVRPGPVVEPEVPAGWAAGGAYATGLDDSLGRWWLRLGDPMLAELVDEARLANTTLAGARATLARSRALRDGAAAALWPSVGLTASAQRSATGDEGAASRYRTGLDASWEIDIFGGRRDAVDASEAAAQASAEDLAGAQVAVAAEVALGYVTLRSAQSRRAIAEDNLATQLETLQITAWRREAGLVSTLELEQAQSAAQGTRSLLPALQVAIAQSGHALAVLTGRPPAALASRLEPARPMPRPEETLAIAIPADTLRQRPDVRAAERRIAAALSRVSQAQAARLPVFSLGGSVGLEALTLAALTHGASFARSIVASVSMPLVDGGARRAQVRAEEAALDEARAAYAAAVLTALKDVEDALVALRGDRERLVHLESASLSAGNAALLARQRFASGLVDFQVVLDTQRTRLATQEAAANADADVVADHVRLYRALGGGWRPESDPPPPSASASRASPS